MLSSGHCFALEAAQIEEAAAQTIVKLDLQIELPSEQTGTGLLWNFNLPYIDISTSLLWAGLVLMLIFTLYMLRDELPRLVFKGSQNWQRDRDIDGNPGAGGSIGLHAASANDLASQGRYVEAMHSLLLLSFAEIREKLGIGFADSLTSREILRRIPLPESGKKSLKDIIARVELSYFGAYPATAGDYNACRESFDALMQLLRTGTDASRTRS